MRCIYCGFENGKEAKNCTNCGRSISTIVNGAPGALASILAGVNTPPEIPDEPEPPSFNRSAAAIPPENEQAFSFNAATPPPEEVNLPNWMSENPTPPPMPNLSFDISQAPAPPKDKSSGVSKAVSLEELGVFDMPVVPQAAPLPPPKEVREVKEASEIKRVKSVPPKAVAPVPQKNMPLTSNEFVCPRCKKVRETRGAVMVTDGNASRRVCYQCARETHSSERVLTRARASDWIPALLSGLVMAVICGGLIYGLTILIPQVWFVGLAVAGIFVGSAVRMGANNRSGVSLSVIAVLMTLVAYGVCVYVNLVVLYRLRWFSWEEFNARLSQVSVSPLEWGGLVLGLVLAVVLTIDWGKN
jgi:hypothetical protein